MKEEKGYYQEEDNECPVCHLWRSGGYHYDTPPHEPGSWECRAVKTNTINPDKPWGQHIQLKCSKCGMTGWSTKNIDYIGARTIFFDVKMKGLEECDCDALLVPVE